MLRAILIDGNSEPTSALRYLADTCGILLTVRQFQYAPTPHELLRSLSLQPEVLLIDLTDATMASADLVMKNNPQTLIIGLGSPSRSSGSAFDILLGHNPSPESLTNAVSMAVAARLSHDKCKLVTFIPAKAGSGSSTIALNAAVSFAKVHRQRVLLIDGDLRSSVITAMVDQDPHTGIEVLFGQLDNLLMLDLDQSILRWHGVDLMLSTRSLDSPMPSAAHYLRLLRLAAGHYDTVILDLPELINPATLAAVRASNELFVVCTPEIPSLTLAKQRLTELNRLGLLTDRVGVIVNRWHRADPSNEAFEGLLGQSRIYKFPNDYLTVRNSFAAGAPIRPSKLVTAIDEFTGHLFNNGIKTPGKVNIFKNFFSLDRA